MLACVLILDDRPNPELRNFVPTPQYQHDSRSETNNHIAWETKVAAVELWKAGVTSATILKQLKISKWSLMRILRKVKENPLNPDLDRKKGTGPQKLIKPETLATMKKVAE